MGARDAAFALFGLTVVPPGQEVVEYLDSGRELIAALTPWLHERAHPNFLAPVDANEHDTRKAYDPEVYDKLQEIKTHYDPQNRFCINHNIPPGRSVPDPAR